MANEDPCPELWLAPQRPATERTFVGRTQILGALQKTVRAGYSAGLVGAGGMGKTSTLLALGRSLAAAGRASSYVGVERGDTARDAARRIAEAVADQGTLAAGDRARADSRLASGMIKEALEALASEAAAHDARGRPPIVLVDDCHRMASEERGTLWSALNSIVDHTRIAMVLSGRPPLWDEVHGQGSPCWHLLQPKITLGPFSRAETQELCGKAAAEGLRMGRGAASALHREVAGYPYGLCHVLYQLALAESPVTLETVRDMACRPEVVIEISSRRGTVSTASTTPTPSGAVGAASPRRIFLLHASADEPLAEELRAHLSPMKRQGEAAPDLELLPGADIDAEIGNRIDLADVVLALVSSDFFASEDCQRRLSHAHARAAAHGRPTVVPVLARAVSLEGTSLAGLHALPPNGQPVALTGDRDQRDVAWTNVIAGLRRLLASRGG